MATHLFWLAQITSLKAKKTRITVLKEYSNYADVFFEKLAAMLLEHTNINTHAIGLKEAEQPTYRPIYSLKLMELKTFKIYNKINLANCFIQYFHSPAGAIIIIFY